MRTSLKLIFIFKLSMVSALVYPLYKVTLYRRIRIRARLRRVHLRQHAIRLHIDGGKGGKVRHIDGA